MPDSTERSRVVAVVVAFNRRELLAEALTALAAQSHPLAGVVVVDNASTDGTSELVRELAPDVDLVRLERNTGGAGGFAVGMARALVHHDPDWLWLMDDDTVPHNTAAEELVRVVASRPDVDVAGSRVIWIDGRDHPMNTPRVKPFVRRAERRAAAESNAVPVRSSSFVSMMVRASAARERGLPIADYFIWNDDFEYSTRLLRRRRGLHVPASVVVHKTKALVGTDADPGERFFFEVRNKLWLLRRSRSLNPGEKLLYGGSTLRRWLRTFRKSADRGVLWRELRRGLRTGWGTRPAPNITVLAELGSASDDVVAIEQANGPRAGSGRERG